VSQGQIDEPRALFWSHCGITFGGFQQWVYGNVWSHAIYAIYEKPVYLLKERSRSSDRYIGGLVSLAQSFKRLDERHRVPTRAEKMYYIYFRFTFTNPCGVEGLGLNHGRRN
jgi:hypothetical protein